MRWKALPLLLFLLAPAGCGTDPSPGPTVTWTEDYACDETPLTCADDYLRLAREMAPTIDLEACRAETVGRVRQLATVPVPPQQLPLTAEELAVRVRAELGIDSWLEGLDARPLDSRVLSRRQLPGGVEQVGRVRDPHVGAMRIRLLWPDTAARPLPAVISLPGHPDPDWGDREILDRYGTPLMKAGFLVALPAWRAYDGWNVESEATTSLLCAGSSLTAVRQYEILLVDKLLRWLRTEGKVGRIGLVGHSGGSVAGTLLARHVFTFDALVRDMEARFAWGLPCDPEPEALFCVQEETHLGLHPLRALIQAGDLVPHRVPVLQQAYDYPDGMDATITFLRQHLVAAEPESTPGP